MGKTYEKYVFVLLFMRYIINTFHISNTIKPSDYYFIDFDYKADNNVYLPVIELIIKIILQCLRFFLKTL